MTAGETSTTPDRWTADLVLALRLADVRGDAIGDAVRVVRDHCEESGEHPRDAFGPADEYARELAASLPAAARTPSSWRQPAAIATASTSGALLLLAGVTGLAGDERAVVRVGDLAVVAGVLVAALALHRLVAGLVRRVWPVAVVVGLGIAVPVVLAALVPGTLLTLPAPAAVGLGVGALLSTAVAVAVGLRRTVTPVVDPVTGQDGSPVGWTARAAVLVPLLLLGIGVAVAATTGSGG